MASSDETIFDPLVEEQLRARVGSYLVGSLDGRGLRVGIACGRFNGGVTTRLLVGALDALEECGVERSDIAVAWAPGAFELPLLARAFATAPTPFDAVVTLGAVIRGDTPHFDYVAGEAARGISDATAATGVPMAFGILTTNTVEQATDRAGGKLGNKGYDAAMTAIEMALTLRGLRARN